MEQLSIESKLKLQQFINEVENVIEYDSDIKEIVDIKPKLIIEFFKENGYYYNEGEMWDDEEYLIYLYKENPNFNEEDENSIESINIELLINIFDYTSILRMSEE